MTEIPIKFTAKETNRLSPTSQAVSEDKMFHQVKCVHRSSGVINHCERFDMKRKPVPCSKVLKPIVQLACDAVRIFHRTKVTRIGMEGLKPPYLLLCNHNAFLDIPIAGSVMKPYFPNFVVSNDGFIGREELMRSVGCMCKRKFTNDLHLIRNLRQVIKNGDVAGIYPEARYSLCGTTAILPESLGKLCKMLKVPVVVLMTHGHHINHPFWNTRHTRGVRHIEAELKLLYTAEKLENLTIDEVNDGLVEALQYDDFAWQKERGIKVKCRDRAEGLEKVLYQCPHCGTEYAMKSSGTKISCGACGKVWEMTEYGELVAENGATEYSHIPDWYEWERKNVQREVAEGTYSTGELPVRVMTLPNSSHFIDMGTGTMVHDMNGFHVETTTADGHKYTMKKTVGSMYSAHIEYEYLFRFGDRIDLSTLDDTWYVGPYDCRYALTKMALATEELFLDYRRKEGRSTRAGLA